MRFHVSERIRSMGYRRRQKRYNELFLDAYIELDKICCHKFGVSNGGVTSYINRLINARFAPGRDEALPRLVRYRNIRNRIAHERGALEHIGEVAKADLKWIHRFCKQLNRKRDPFSLYLKKARRHAKKRKFVRALVIAGVVLAVAAAAVATFLILK